VGPGMSSTRYLLSVSATLSATVAALLWVVLP
jgi:hypothetical protein